ncbi:hypothetical protein AB0G15_42895 [Streptosporangium sp. NPDC023825]|uniref:hypothetical protein n=1 Tax=Streptosporangium sp. NPDC023825 TaxID=3154909 RepID=UPI00343D1C05
MSVPTAPDPFTPRVTRPAGLDWVKFDADLARDGSVDPVDKALYAALASFVDAEERDSDPDPGGRDVPTRARLAQCIGRSLDTVDRSTKRLEDRGLLHVHRRRDPANPRLHLPSVYELLDHERWDERAAARAKARQEARGGRMDAARGSRTGAARGGRMDAARGSRTGAADVFREGVEKEEEPPPPPVPHAPQAPPAVVTAEEGEEGEISGNTPPVSAEAVAWVRALPWRRQPGQRQRERLAELVTQAWTVGWTPDALQRELVVELEGVRSLYAVWTTRLQDLAPPRPSLPLSGDLRALQEPPCPTHPGAGRRGDGECARCWVDRLETEDDRRLAETTGVSLYAVKDAG